MGQWLEEHRAGRALLALVAAAVLLVLVAWNLPDSSLRRALLPPVRPYALAVGLDQNWAVFAPNPRSQALDVVAVVRFVDGTTVTWVPPAASEPVFTPARTYRWGKWVENVRADANPGLWSPAVDWVLREVAETDGRAVRQVDLVRRWYDVARAGEPAGEPAWQSYTFHTRVVSP